MRRPTADNKRKLSYILLALCAVASVGLFVFIPNFLNCDIGFANDKLRAEIPRSERSDYMQEFSNDLPLLYLSVEDINLLYPHWDALPDGSGGALPPREITIATMYLFDSENNTLNDVPAQRFENVWMRLRGRTSSYTQHKNPFALELHQQSGKIMKQPILSLPPESDFVLYAPFNDRSMIRNYLAYTLGGELLNYSPRCEFVEIFVNQKDDPISRDDYKGVYLLTEKIKKGKNRIDVGKFHIALDPNRQFEEGGGFIVKQDHFEPGFDKAYLLMPTPSGETFQIKYPKLGELTYAQAEAIKSELDFFDDIIVNGTDEQLEKYLDVDSFVDMLLLNEYLKNSEGMIYSAYYYRTKGGKLICGPPWDFDIGIGNVDYNPEFSNSEGMNTLTLETSARLLAHPAFKTRLIERWRELRSGGGTFSESHVDEVIDSVNAKLKYASLRNDAAYPELYDGSFDVFGNSPSFHPKSSLEDREMIREFLKLRGRWLDENIPRL
ncbi:MAG: CotH kinase family protein [Oscillospiraceae bacterium]